MNMLSRTGTIFDIQRFSTHDGPGVRTTVFFKGCPLSCFWCSNPESQSNAFQVLQFTNLCKGCGQCAAQCPAKALRMKNGLPTRDAERCMACGQCCTLCPAGAQSLSGTKVQVQELCEQVRQDWRLFMQSGGGVTCSGGEALMQPEFLHALLTTLHDSLGFHTCLDTTAHAPWHALSPLLAVTDLFLVDIKHMDEAQHRQATGVGNSTILKNIQRLASEGAAVRIRVPLIPAYNDTDENLAQLAAFLQRANLRHVELMPYHSFGLSKYAALGRVPVEPHGDAVRLQAAVDTLSQHHLHVEVHRH